MCEDQPQLVARNLKSGMPKVISLLSSSQSKLSEIALVLASTCVSEKESSEAMVGELPALFRLLSSYVVTHTLSITDTDTNTNTNNTDTAQTFHPLHCVCFNAWKDWIPIDSGTQFRNVRRPRDWCCQNFFTPSHERAPRNCWTLFWNGKNYWESCYKFRCKKIIYYKY